MELLNDDLFKPFDGDEIENLDSIQIRGGNGAVDTDRWVLHDGGANYIDCSSDSSVNGETVAGYDCDCINTDEGTRRPC